MMSPALMKFALATGGPLEPVLSAQDHWVGVLVIAILAGFVAAALVGPLVRLHSPAEPPTNTHEDAHGHDTHGAH